MAKVTNADNLLFLESVKSELRRNECTIQPTELGDGTALFVEVRYSGRGTDLRTPLNKVASIHERLARQMAGKDVLVIVADDDGCLRLDDHCSVALAWIAFRSLPEGSNERDQLFWAWERLDELTEKAPEEAWSIINRIREMDGSDSILGILAAGPLEDLLVDHGPEFIDRVETLARQDKQFRKLLGAVWQNAMPDDLWNRVKAAADPSW